MRQTRLGAGRLQPGARRLSYTESTPAPALGALGCRWGRLWDAPSRVRGYLEPLRQPRRLQSALSTLSPPRLRAGIPGAAAEGGPRRSGPKDWGRSSGGSRAQEIGSGWALLWGHFLAPIPSRRCPRPYTLILTSLGEFVQAGTQSSLTESIPNPHIVLVAQWCLALCHPMDCSPARLLCPWDFPGKGTAVGCHSFLQGIFPTQGSNPSLLNYRQILFNLTLI